MFANAEGHSQQPGAKRLHANHNYPIKETTVLYIYMCALLKCISITGIFDMWFKYL